MASGNQVCNPICADFPTAPKNKKTAIISTSCVGYKPIIDCNAEKSSVWQTTTIIERPLNKNRSPTLLIKNAFVAALPACALVNQKPIRR